MIAGLLLGIWLLGVGSECMASDGSLTFEARVTKDTVLTFEPVWVRFFAVNNTGATIECYPMRLEDNSIMLEMFDESGESALGSYVTSGRSNTGVPLDPGDTLWGHGNLLNNSIAWDPASRKQYFPPGHYGAIFHWQHDLTGSAPTSANTILVDSVSFVVVAPVGRDAQVLQTYLELRSRYYPPQEWGQAYWEYFVGNKTSPYGEIALNGLAILVSGGAVPPPEGLTRPQVVFEFATRCPDNPTLESPLKRVARKLSSDESYQFLSSIRDSVPGTIASKYATQLLESEE